MTNCLICNEIGTIKVHCLLNHNYCAKCISFLNYCPFCTLQNYLSFSRSKIVFIMYRFCIHRDINKYFSN